MSGATAGPALGRDERIRLIIAVSLIGAVYLALMGRLYAIQVDGHEGYVRKAIDQQWRRLPLAARRGDVVDRHGVVLARSIATFTVVCDPKHLPDPELATEMLANALSLSPPERRKLLERFCVPGRRFVYVKRRASDAEAKRVKALRIDGVFFETEYERVHPRGQIADQVIGRVGVDGAGLSGIELTFDARLRGEPGLMAFEVDSRGRPVDRGRNVSRPARDGATVALTLDVRIQDVVEAALDEAVAKWKPKWATAVVLDPEGRTLALGNRPVPGRNRAIADYVEPGSVMKAPIAAFARNEGVVGPQEVLDGGIGRFGRRSIKDDHPVGRVPFPEAIVHSSNRIMAQLGVRLGPARLQRALDLCGFGEKTGVPLPWEAKGKVTAASDWTSYSTTSVPMGQEVGVTALQLARSYLPFAAGGRLPEIALVEAIRDASGRTVEAFAPRPGEPVLRPEIAREMRDILVRVVEEGTGKPARIEGIKVGGKTGTAQKFGRGGRLPGKYVASFVALAPADAPRMVVCVCVDEPQGAIYGSAVAAPAVKRIIEEGLRAAEGPAARGPGGDGDAVGRSDRGGAPAR